MSNHTADSFAPELIRLWRDHNELSRRAGLQSGTPEWIRRENRQNAVYGHIKSVEAAASYAPVEGPYGIVLLLGLIADAASALESLVPAGVADERAEEISNAISRMSYALVRWIEAVHRIDRADAAGDIYLAARCDPFDPRSTEPAEAA